METVAKLLDSAGTKEEKGYTALHLAVQAGNSDLVRQLLPLPACDPSAKDVDGLTALHWAASKGKLMSTNTFRSDSLCVHTDLGSSPSFAEECTFGNLSSDLYH